MSNPRIIGCSGEGWLVMHPDDLAAMETAAQPMPAGVNFDIAVKALGGWAINVMRARKVGD